MSDIMSLIEFLHQLNENDSISSPSLLANYGQFEHFRDMLGDNSRHQPRILSNYRDNMADFDPNGTHVCFSSNIFGEPKVMPKLKFGLIFDYNKVCQICEQSGWTEPKRYDDIAVRLAKSSELDQFNIDPDSAVYRKNPTDYRGKAYKKEARYAAQIKLVGLIKILNKQNQLKYFLCFEAYTWREISKNLFEALRNELLHQIQKDSKSLKTYKLSIFGSDIDYSGNKLKYFTHEENEPSLYSSLTDMKEIKEAYIFGHDTKLLIDLDLSDKNLSPEFKRLNIKQQAIRNGYVLSASGSKKADAMNIGVNNLTYLDPEGNQTTVYDELKKVFNEDEYRIYRKSAAERFDKKQRFFEFKTQDVVAIALPKESSLYEQDNRASKLYPIQKIFNYWEKSSASSMSEDMNNSLFESKYIENSNYLDLSNIFWWQNPNDKEWNSLAYVDGKLSRIRSCVLIIRETRTEYQACIVYPNESASIYELPGGGLNVKDARKIDFTTDGKKIYEITNRTDLLPLEFNSYPNIDLNDLNLYRGKAENPADTAAREAEEEVNIKVDPQQMKFIGAYIKDFNSKWVKNNVPKEIQWDRYYTYLYAVKIINSPAGNSIPEEEFSWVPIKDLITDPKFNSNPIWMKAIAEMNIPIDKTLQSDSYNQDMIDQIIKDEKKFQNRKLLSTEIPETSGLSNDDLRELQRIFMYIKNNYGLNKIEWY